LHSVKPFKSLDEPYLANNPKTSLEIW